MDMTGQTRRYPATMLLAIFAAGLVTVLGVAGFMGLAINSVDTDALQHQRRMVTKAMETTIETAIQNQGELSTWDEMLEAIDDEDVQWLTDHLASEAYEFFDQDQIYILDETGEPLYAAREGSAMAPERFETIRAVVTPLLEQLDSPTKRAALNAYKRGSRELASLAHDFAIVRGIPAIIVASPVVSDTRRLNAAEGAEPIMVSVTLLGPDLGRDLADQYLLREPHFSQRPGWVAPEAVLPLRNAAGEAVTWLKWLPDRPGRRILGDTLPALGLALLVAGTIIALLLRNLQRTSNQLLAERAEAHHRALHDPLTGLGNRALFDDRLADALKHLPPGPSRLALHCLDLDSFKPVNDTLGHKAGDELLRQVAQRITAQLAPRDILVRMGGDEFAIIQPGISGPDQPADLASCIIAAIRQPFTLQAGTVQIGISIGIATAPDSASTEVDLMVRADSALYQAKAGGRNRYRFFSEASPGAGGPADLNERLQTAFVARGAA
ncbi:diguanylate cyclase [Devosia sp. FKR38]|uniref:diguanylate cyclase domain-containing protein n=1 Tax=Devosia sp. FKR38 TaxID=2562312 RepID=UPI00148523EB|nr:diguanylate cyclase [Devosia sp. FKR38]